MFTKKLIPATVSVALLSATALTQAMDDAPIAVNVTLATDYTFRGVSQTDEKPAIQGGLDYEHDTGLYIGIWASNVNFGSGSNASTEMDYYGGFAGETDGGFGYDIGYIFYDYKGDSHFDYQEISLSFSYAGFGAGVIYSDEYLGNDGPEFWYPFVDYSYSFANDISVDLHAGYNDASDADFDFFGSDDSYTDWSVTFGYNYLGLDFALAYVDTDLDDLDAADARAVFSISKSM